MGNCEEIEGKLCIFWIPSWVFCLFCFFCFLILSNHIRNYSGGIIIFSEQEQYLSCNCCICVTFWILEIFLLKNMNKLINTLQMEPFMLLNALYYPKTTTCLYRPVVLFFFFFSFFFSYVIVFLFKGHWLIKCQTKHNADY